MLIPIALSAQVTFNEIANGDLGDPIDALTTLVGDLGVGVNTVDGSLDNTFTFLDRDAFTFIVPDGLQLDSLSFTALDGDDRFYALSNRNTALATNTAGGNYYTSLIGADSIDVNLLDGTVNSLKPAGLSESGPLAAGEYTFWLQETDFSVASYSLSLTTSVAVPEPSPTLILFCSGGVIFLSQRRRTEF